MKHGWIVPAAGLALSAAPAMAWNAHGHRTITRLALDGLAPDAPAFLRDPAVVARVAEQSNEADRWRGIRTPPILSGANPEHYIDVEDLDQFGLTLKSVPRYRYDFVKAMTAARLEHPDRVAPVETPDPDHVKEWPGFLPYAIDEHFAKLQSAFNTLRILEQVGDPARAAAAAQARENVIYEMGMLSHFVGDAAQPLHTTRHHHGWVGDNPNGYTRDHAFHAYIDGGVLTLHRLDVETLKSSMSYDRAIKASEVWDAGLDEIARSFAQVEPLYQLQKSGDLEREAGKTFITARLTDAASTLAAMYNAAWESSRPRPGDVSSYVKFSEMAPAPQATPAPAGK
jgi:hypothetical protein